MSTGREAPVPLSLPCPVLPQRFATTWLVSTWSSFLALGGGETLPERISSGVIDLP